MTAYKNTLTILLLTLCVISCGKNDEPTPVADPTSVIDIDGNVYTVAKICSKFWMTQNLKTTKYNDGTAIITGLSNDAWRSATTGAYSIYEANDANNVTYGKLYNWFAAADSRLAPTGWHVATEAEWDELVTCLGGSPVAGGKMKSTAPLWEAPNAGASNSSGFNGLPAGYRSNSGLYAQQGKSGYFWGSNERNATQGEYLVIDNDVAGAARNGATKQFGYSIRCIRN